MTRIDHAIAALNKNARIDFANTQYMNVVGRAGLEPVPIGSTRFTNPLEVNVRLSDTPDPSIRGTHQPHVAQLRTTRQPQFTKGGFLAGVFNLHPETVRAHGSAAYQSRYAEGKQFFGPLSTVIEALLYTPMGGMIGIAGISTKVGSKQLISQQTTQKVLAKKTDRIQAEITHIKAQLQQKERHLTEQNNAANVLIQRLQRLLDHGNHGPDAFPVGSETQRVAHRMINGARTPDNTTAQEIAALRARLAELENTLKVIQ